MTLNRASHLVVQTTEKLIQLKTGSKLTHSFVI